MTDSDEFRVYDKKMEGRRELRELLAVRVAPELAQTIENEYGDRHLSAKMVGSGSPELRVSDLRGGQMYGTLGLEVLANQLAHRFRSGTDPVDVLKDALVAGGMPPGDAKPRARNFMRSWVGNEGDAWADEHGLRQLARRLLRDYRAGDSAPSAETLEAKRGADPATGGVGYNRTL